ncbi:terbinafine resistance locus protein (yip1), putative [Trypanosoma equiperdum]|uniref:Protein YIPF n=3 Tax=Trypanozoon TaxID=39700 RepID=Q581W2_TRYB2|nr:terbinafine resistance locus protein (yip1), putative [Trypanosoma brucei brucei TREU927]AAX79441.1 terbinafine resistance locus protein (yip1), putative [Trypanosoma brucei]AAZ12987.1 terbinafine resistance locus protein (yip1), putative [Trypanosoma brucei brucei TREU927]RHW70806.1 terbinafine resistance locus protein (yip1) [Trypanosoma brucei equiperdum]SCU68294.1 terbinafine resistance locus protein (yip1), putative [Trypanosoma equiperdum]
MSQQVGEVPSPYAHSTLDEPVLETIKRDFFAIGRKLLAVLIPPLGSKSDLRDWELWGPLLFSLTLAIILALSAGEHQGGLIFSAVFVLVWVGAALVTLNAKFLGSPISFFQTVCVMGYCMAPLCVGAIIGVLIPSFWVSLVVSSFVWVWCCWAALCSFRGCVSPDREMLVVYPVGLFYLFMTWMVMVGS